MRALAIPVATLALAARAAAQPATAGGTDSAGVREELTRLYVDARAAALRGDRAALERVYADDFRFVHATGGTDDKAEWVTKTLSVDPAWLSFRPGLRLDVLGGAAVLRGRAGDVWGTAIYARRDGRWQLLQIQSTRLLPERAAVAVDPRVLDAYAGRYEVAPNSFVTFARDGNSLLARGAARPSVRWVPLSETRLFLTSADNEVTFYRDARGRVTHYVVRRSGGEEVVTGRRVSPPR